MNFESSQEIEQKRLEKKQVREHLLNEAKRKYDIEERKIAAAKARGEDQWMLPELSQQIDEKSKKLKRKTKKLKKEKKSKSEKKNKKKKKSSRNSSESEASSDDQWVEKGKKVETPVVMETVNNAVTDIPVASEKPAKGPVLQRDDWMTLDAVSIPTISRQELRQKIKEDKLQYADQKQEKEMNMDEAGTHERELNPYWKGGAGSGLPEEAKAAVTVPKHDLAFLKKAYTRCELEAEETGQSLESVVSLRYGSLEQLETMIMEAERAEELAKAPHAERRGRGEPQARRGDRRRGATDRLQGRRHDRSRSRSRSRERSRDGRRYIKNRSHSRDRYRGRHSRSRSRSRDRKHGNGSKDRERRRSRSHNNDRHRSRSSERRSRRRSSSSGSASGGERRKHGSSGGPSKDGRRFIKPGEAGGQKSKRAFLRPGETREASRHAAGVSAAGQPSWKKPGHALSGAEPALQADKSKVSRSPSSSSDSSSEQGADNSDSSSEPETATTVVPLTDDEMNALGAKLLRAELMGNDELVKEIKDKMEAARQLKKSRVAPPAPTDREKVVMLSSADKFGNVRPVQSPGAESGRGGGKRRRAKKIQTHDKKGERERYFADDDRFSIRDMVQAEKMTSAEDHHMTFSKMAAKVNEKIDDDNQIDDAMINRARLEHDPDKMAAMQRQQAHSDSKKLAQTLENCQHCLDNMTKHLIIAVHKNTYLCVPAQQSLNEGHCKIVPIHHCISSTTCDEDVWNEVQEFRRALVRMFTDNEDQDCVFMECSKNLRRHPHMVIECVPIERQLGDLAPIYFKKAIDESEKEWAQNKKLVDLSKKDIRHSVPKGFPYFAVDFGLQGGFAHVIEDEQTFPAYFGKEVIGGMMDVDPGLWRKPKKEPFEQQRKKVVEFAKMFKPYDFTRHTANSDSE